MRNNGYLLFILQLAAKAALAAGPYQTRIFEAGTTFGAPDTSGPWSLGRSQIGTTHDLSYIKTSNTGTGTVEVHTASGTSKYQSRILDVGTTFSPENDGTWQLIDADSDGKPVLVFIKTSNTGTGKVEVH